MPARDGYAIGYAAIAIVAAAAVISTLLVHGVVAVRMAALPHAEVVAAAAAHRRRGGPVLRVASALAPGGAAYAVTGTDDAGGWGTVVFAAGTAGTLVAAAAHGENATHTAVRRGGLVQKVFGTAGRPSAVANTDALPDEAGPVPGQAGSARRAVCAASHFTDAATGRTVIRVGVLHTSEVLALDYYAGRSAAVQAEVAVAVAVANAEAFPRSGVSVALELCANEPVSPSPERRSPRATLDAFARSPAVSAVAAANRCDAMVLFSTLAALGDRACGVGQRPGTRAVVAADCFVENLSFLHELGHNLGACHGPPASVCADGANGYGDATGVFRTILAYRAACGGGNCTRVPRFSSADPAVAWQGRPAGDAARDNARALNAHKETAASTVC